MKQSEGTSKQQGLSIVELLVVIAVAALLIVALTVLVSRLFLVSRSQFEQVRITEEARVQLDRLSEVIRNARHVDCDNSGTIDKPNEAWGQVLEPYRLQIYTNIDADTTPERVQYELRDGLLYRTIDQPGRGTCDWRAGQPQVVARALRNVSVTENLFSYIAADGSFLTSPVAVGSVLRVGVHLNVDVSDVQDPPAAIIDTEVTPRLVQRASAGSAPAREVRLEIKRENEDDTAFTESVTISRGDQVVLRWEGVGVSSCSGNWTRQRIDTAGQATVRPQQSFTYIVTCLDDGQTVTDTAAVVVGQTVARCGNGQVESGEQCDDGNTSNSDTCTTACVSAACGDGYVWIGQEACDDSNTAAGDGCSPTCQTEAQCSCGSWRNAGCGQGCPAGQQRETRSCSPNACQAESRCVSTQACRPRAMCGNGVVEGGEQCDDGNANDTDGCTRSCRECKCSEWEMIGTSGTSSCGYQECSPTQKKQVRHCNPITCAAATECVSRTECR